MSTALTTAVLLSVAGLAVSIVLGFTAASSEAILQHTTLAIFVTLVTLLSHSMVIFYLIGKGRAVKEAVSEGGLSPTFVSEVSRARGPVFGIATLAIALTMATAILGGGVDTGVIPSGIHSVLAFSSLAVNLAAVRAEVTALVSSSRIAAEIDRLL